MQFDELSTGVGRCFDLNRVGADEKADLDASIVHALASFCDGFETGRDFESALGSDFLSSFRNDTDNVGLQGESDLNDFRGIGHFEIQTCPDLSPERLDVAILDMAA